jgi:hypothetical protein
VPGTFEATLIGDPPQAQFRELVAAQVAHRERCAVRRHADGQHAMRRRANLDDSALPEPVDVDQPTAVGDDRLVMCDWREHTCGVDPAAVRIVAKLRHRAAVPVLVTVNR